MITRIHIAAFVVATSGARFAMASLYHQPQTQLERKVSHG